MSIKEQKIKGLSKKKKANVSVKTSFDKSVLGEKRMLSLLEVVSE